MAIRDNNAWKLSKEYHAFTNASLIIQPDTAWKLFTKGITPKTAMENVFINGDKKLATVGLALVAVMA